MRRLTLGVGLSLAVIPFFDIGDLRKRAVERRPDDGLASPRHEREGSAQKRKVLPMEGQGWTVPGLDLAMVWIPPGEFVMGSPLGEDGRDADETQHRVTLTKGFWLGKYEVTQGEWEKVMGRNPGNRRVVGRDLPADYMSWSDAIDFCRKLTEGESRGGRIPAGYEYTLPTEAQWEYACRANTQGAFVDGNSLSSRKANFDGNFPYGKAEKGAFLGRTIKVGSYNPNTWGLFDMHGNVWEWCLDRYGAYPEGDTTDPVGPASGTNRVVRGGSWFDNARYCRSSVRVKSNHSNRREIVGFRLALAPVL